MQHINWEFLHTLLISAKIFFLCIIEPTEYVDYLFELKSKFGTPNLTRFEDLSNKEMMWVITEVVLETNIRNRAKIIKEFIKVRKLFGWIPASKTGSIHYCLGRGSVYHPRAFYL